MHIKFRESKVLRKWWKLLAAFLCKEKELCFLVLTKILKERDDADFQSKALRVGGDF